MTSQQIPRKPNAEEGFCEPNDLELRFWMTRERQDKRIGNATEYKKGPCFICPLQILWCGQCKLRSREDELCSILIPKNMIIYIIGILWISASIWQRAIDIWSIILAVRISGTHPDRLLLSSSWHCVLTSHHIHCSALCAYCGPCRMWRVCVKTKNIVVTLCPNMVHLCIGLAISCCCARLSSNSEQKPKAGWGHCGLSGWAIKFWYVVNMVAKQVSYATLITGFDHQKKATRKMWLINC